MSRLPVLRTSISRLACSTARLRTSSTTAPLCWPTLRRRVRAALSTASTATAITRRSTAASLSSTATRWLAACRWTTPRSGRPSPRLSTPTAPTLRLRTVPSTASTIRCSPPSRAWSKSCRARSFMTRVPTTTSMHLNTTTS